LLADREWLDDATKTIGQYWRRKNERRRGMVMATRGDHEGPCDRKYAKKPPTISSTFSTPEGGNRVAEN
jgi:hypothetical protein